MTSLTLKAPPGEWLAEDVSDADRQRLFDLHAAADADAVGNNRAIRWGGYLVGAAGALIGVAGLACATVVFVIKEDRAPAFIAYDPVKHVTLETVSAANAASKLFGNEQAAHDLRFYLEAREMWAFDTADIAFHRVMIMSTQDEQAKFATDWSFKNPRSPRARYGRNTTVRVDNLRFASGATSPNGTRQWFVRYARSEITNGSPAPPQEFLATVSFAWHPELPMADEADRAINQSGFQVITYTSGPA